MLNTNNMLADVSKYMFTLRNMSNIDIIMNEDKSKPNIVAPKKNITNIVDIFFPKQRDQVFWCFYIILNDITNYEMVHNYFTTEKETKYKWIEEFRSKKELFKPIKVSRNTVEDELANAKSITMASIKALCHLKDVNVFFIDGKKYYEMLTNDEKPIFVIEKIDGKFGLKQKSSKEKVQYYRDHYWKLENLDKPLKAVSSYKSDELKDICKRLHIDAHDMTKSQMYEKILSKL